MEDRFDLAVIGGGIVGLAHAWAAARLGRRVVVIDRDTQAQGASIRNFGFVTVTGQARGASWRRARRTRDLWDQMASDAGIAIVQRGLIVLVRRPESLPILEAFLATEMGEGCELWDAARVRQRLGRLAASETLGALYSPHDLRVDSRRAVPRLAAFLEARHGVTFRRGVAALAVAPPVIETSRGPIEAEAAIVCPGDDLTALFPEAFAAHGVERCALSMLRLADPGIRLPAPLMSDLGLIRYPGYAALSETAALRGHFAQAKAEAIAHGVHLICVQNDDGTLVVGDSHHYGQAAGLFMASRTESLILEEFTAATGLAPPPVIERWSGTYGALPEAPVLILSPSPRVRLVTVTNGKGASTAFAIAEEVVGELYGVDLAAAA